MAHPKVEKTNAARLLDRAKIAYEFWPDYDGVGPVLYAESVEPAQEIKDIVQF